MKDPLILFESFLQWDKQKKLSLNFNLISWNMRPNANSMMVEGRKWLKIIDISEHMLSINQNTYINNKYKQTWKLQKWFKKKSMSVRGSILDNMVWTLPVKSRAPEWNIEVRPVYFIAYKLQDHRDPTKGTL